MPLVFVPTPLGNLRDITLRALDALRDADLVVAEDTRVARRLLHALGLPGRELWSYREQNAAGATPAILERARIGLVAVTTDAGMPGISDPGSELIVAAREAGVPIDVLPGPSAALGVAVLSGFPLRRFLFEGFPPRTSQERRARFARAISLCVTTIWFESPRRIQATLSDLSAVVPEAAVFLLREYTKLHEQQLCGTAESVAAQLERPVRGEIAFALAPWQMPERVPVQTETDAHILTMLQQGQKVRDIANLLSEQGAGTRNELYVRVSVVKASMGKGRDSGAEEQSQ